MILRFPRVGRQGRRAAALVEATLVISVALMLLYGIVEYARYLMVLHVANNAVRSGARYAVVNTGNGTTSAQVQAVVTSNMAGVDSNITGYTVNVFTVDPTGIYNTGTNTYNYPPTLQQKSGSTWSDAQFAGGIAVQITGTYQPIVPKLLFADTPLTVNVTAVMGSEAN